MPASSINTIIDTARDILVGKLPNPQDQIDAITYTLMCKFMSDIDDDSAALGGKRAYFTGDYEKYDWHALMRADGNEQVALFRDAIEKMSRNPNLPPLFRDIFAGALLKFNDPRTLRLFLAEMDKIRHADGNDDLGDAYEYLLSIMASQGGLGQFRTPRHIIEFITAIVAPEKHHRVLDPACGTAGFLIAAYKHILSRHTAPANRLSATDRDLLHKNLRGFDIDPAMIRTARVNMYLHGFKTPDIIEHDTLTSEDRWDERYDIILANPPFMTPKGGIQPHKKFAVAANRAEVLFVDYIASHLKPKGRAGIVVPEGIIFQTANAYKQLRKNLVENQGLAAVISLPAGIFNPYAGVKTSILILDNENAPRRENILFIKIENDGYSLGAQRRPIDKNDLPAALKTAQKYLNTPAMWNAAGTDNATGSSTTTGTGTTCTLVPKAQIAATGDYNLSGDRYTKTQITNAKFPIVKLGDVAELRKGSPITKKDVAPNGTIPVVAGGQQSAYNHDQSNREPDIITVSASGAYAGFVNYWTTPIFASDCTTIKSNDENKLLTRFIYEVLKNQQTEIYKLQTGGGQPHVYSKDLANIELPLPPLPVQEKLVAEIASKQAAIDAARATIAALEREREYFDPRPLALKHNWPTVKLGDIADVRMGETLIKGDLTGTGKPIYSADTSEEPWAHSEPTRLTFGKDTLVVGARGTIGSVKLPDKDAFTCTQTTIAITVTSAKTTPNYIYCVLKAFDWKSITEGVGIPMITVANVNRIELPLPPLSEQARFVSDFSADAAVIAALRATIAKYTDKIAATLAPLFTPDGA